MWLEDFLLMTGGTAEMGVLFVVLEDISLEQGTMTNITLGPEEED